MNFFASSLLLYSMAGLTAFVLPTCKKLLPQEHPAVNCFSKNLRSSSGLKQVLIVQPLSPVRSKVMYPRIFFFFFFSHHLYYRLWIGPDVSFRQFLSKWHPWHFFSPMFFLFFSLAGPFFAPKVLAPGTPRFFVNVWAGRCFCAPVRLVSSFSYALGTHNCSLILRSRVWSSFSLQSPAPWPDISISTIRRPARPQLIPGSVFLVSLIRIRLEFHRCLFFFFSSSPFRCPPLLTRRKYSDPPLPRHCTILYVPPKRWRRSLALTSFSPDFLPVLYVRLSTGSTIYPVSYFFALPPALNLSKSQEAQKR